MKKYLIIIGNFGSGKTELALNIAFEAAETKKVTFVDLDIVNPYFRSTERKAELEAAGIRLLSPISALRFRAFPPKSFPHSRITATLLFSMSEVTTPGQLHSASTTVSSAKSTAVPLRFCML